MAREAIEMSAAPSVSREIANASSLFTNLSGGQIFRTMSESYLIWCSVKKRILISTPHGQLPDLDPESPGLNLDLAVLKTA